MSQDRFSEDFERVVKGLYGFIEGCSDLLKIRPRVISFEGKNMGLSSQGYQFRGRYRGSGSVSAVSAARVPVSRVILGDLSSQGSKFDNDIEGLISTPVTGTWVVGAFDVFQ